MLTGYADKESAGRAINEVVMDMASGECLFLYTDGLDEARYSEGNLFGRGTLCDSLCRLIEQPLPEMILKLANQAIDFHRASESIDDITIISLEHSKQQER